MNSEFLELKKLLKTEKKRQLSVINLIASENFVSPEILKIVGSALTNKYAEGYPGKRYYEGCQIVDQVESLAILWAKKIFKVEYVNVQPHSGSQANSAAYLVLLKPNDKVLSMHINAGGHLTHGSKVNFSGVFYQFYFYGVDPESGYIDYSEVERIALEVKPRLIVCGASAYPQKIDFLRFREIADRVNAYLMADIAHIAGLIVAGEHQSPIGVADIVTSTTHKTLRGARGGIILADQKWEAAINKAVFPGTQGGPLLHVIAGKAQTFYEASLPNFITYQKKVKRNAQILSNFLIDNNVKVITNGTSNHMLLIDTKISFGITGNIATNLLSKVGIICNMNLIPGDLEKPSITSGIRLGTPAMTTLGYDSKDFEKIGKFIIDVLKLKNNSELNRIKQEIKQFIKNR